MISKVYYSVRNCGDGSAYPTFFEDELCAELHQNLQNENGEGWGETCTGVLEVKSKTPVEFLHITTRKEYIKELEETLEEGNDYYDLVAIEKALKQLKKKGK